MNDKDVIIRKEIMEHLISAGQLISVKGIIDTANPIVKWIQTGECDEELVKKAENAM